MKRTVLFAALSIAAAISAQAEPIVALTSDNRLITFDSAAPATSTETVTITGVASGETLVGIDYRPATGTLFAVSCSTGNARLTCLL